MGNLHKKRRPRRPPAVERSFSRGGVTYQLQRIGCGKPRCGRCPHGPYWYAFSWSKGRTVSTYVGKRLPPALNVDDFGNSLDPDRLVVPELRGRPSIRYGCSGQPGGSWRDCGNDAICQLVDRGRSPRPMCHRCARAFARRCQRDQLPAPRFEPFKR